MKVIFFVGSVVLLVTEVYGFLGRIGGVAYDGSGYYPFRVTQHPIYFPKCKEFVEALDRKMTGHKRTICLGAISLHKAKSFLKVGLTQLCDEAHFWLNRYVNKQNCRIWSEANPQVDVETPLHLEKLTVWCASWAGGIIGPYFFKNDEGHNELWFRQDGVTCHTARATIDLLKDTFGDRLISRFGLVNWPPRSCDLTPLDYFMWGYAKSLVYADKPQTLDHLEDNIRRVIADIRPQMLEKVIENWTSRLDYIRASRGSPMPDIIFKIWKYPRNLESPSVSSKGFGNDSQMMVMRVDVTAQVAPELQCRMRTGIYLAVTAKRNRRSTALDLSR
ncbi:DUF4817 domain-containing protein [Trichonephila clavipes]|nr:DUF4817 domain-containing protein [Trichonephila clavipes]